MQGARAELDHSRVLLYQVTAVVELGEDRGRARTGIQESELGRGEVVSERGRMTLRFCK